MEEKSLRVLSVARSPGENVPDASLNRVGVFRDPFKQSCTDTASTRSRDNVNECQPGPTVKGLVSAFLALAMNRQRRTFALLPL